MPSKTLIYIGNMVKVHRKRSNLTLKQLADKCAVGVNYLSKLERGMANITIEHLEKICSALGIELFEVIPAKISVKADTSFEPLLAKLHSLPVDRQSHTMKAVDHLLRLTNDRDIKLILGLLELMD